MDLKVQADGAGGLEELKDEFMDGRSVRARVHLHPSWTVSGHPTELELTRDALNVTYRIQYAFIRITDGNSELPKFVQIVSPSSSASWPSPPPVL